MQVEYFDNCYRKLYGKEEADRLFSPVARRIFMPSAEPGTLLGVEPKNSALFRAPGWKKIALEYRPWLSWRAFPSERDVPNACMQAKNVEMVSSSTGQPQWDVYRPLWIALIERGVGEIIHMQVPFDRADGTVSGISDQHDLSDTDTDGAIVTLPFTEDLSRAMAPPTSITASGVVFSSEGSWGLFGTDDPEVGVLGGEPDLIDRVIELGGGEDFLNHVFTDAVANRIDPNCPEIDQYYRYVYSCVGWKIPDFLSK